MGRLLYMPTAEEKDRVRKMVSAGASEQDIAAQLDIPVKKLQKVFRCELQQGEAEGKQQVLDKLHEIAAKGSSITATIFWVKSRCGWRDTGSSQRAAVPKLPPFVVTWNGR